MCPQFCVNSHSPQIVWDLLELYDMQVYILEKVSSQIYT